MGDNELKEKIDEADATTIRDKFDEIIKWLETNDNAEAEEFEEKKKEMEAITNPIMTKLYQGAGGEGGGMPGGMPGGLPGGGFPGADAGAAPDAGPKVEEVD